MSRAFPQPFPPIFPIPCEEGCILSYDAYNSSNTKIIDNSGSNNHGTLFNGPIKKSNQYGNVLSFDGIDDYVNIQTPSKKITELSNSFTIIAHVNVANVATTRPVFCGGENVNGHTKNFLRIDTNRKITFDQYLPSGGVITSNSSLELSTDYLIAYTQKSNYRAIIINGNVDIFDNSPEIFSGSTPTSWDVGRRYGQSSMFFYGKMGFIQIYNQFKSPAEIKEIMLDHAWKYGVKI